MKQIIPILLFSLLILTSCNNPGVNILSEEFNYSTYIDEDFSVKYPDWPITNQTEQGAEVSVSKGFCTIMVNSETIPAESWYSSFTNALKTTPNTLSSESIDEDLFIKSITKYGEHNLISEIKIVDCNNKAHLVNVVCIEQVIGEQEVLEIYKTVFDSIECKEEKELEYNTFEEEDFEIEYPEWNDITGHFGEENILAATEGYCTVLVNKHNALPEDLINWLELAIETQDETELIDSDKITDEEYTMKYRGPYENNTLLTNSNILYCNYQSYITAVVCVEENYKEEYEEIKNQVLDSIECKEEYKIPKMEIPEEIEEQEPEVIEEIENTIVQTDAGDEYGINAEAVVYFINNNEFFTKVMSDFDKANLVFEDDENLYLKVMLDNDGKITSIDEGEYSNADVTLYIPIMDALNILNNAANINPINLISFAINVRTDPAETKNEVIGNVLRGEYN